MEGKSLPHIYTAIAGDTLTSVAERFYQDSGKSALIAAASGVFAEELQPGQMLTIP